MLRAHVLGELPLEVGDLVRSLADAVVAEDVLAANARGSSASSSSSPSSMPPGNMGRSGRVRAGGPPSRASRRSMLVSVTLPILDIASEPRKEARRGG